MGGAASKAKGSSFERDVCRQLSLWVTAGQRTDVFWRSAMSGGRATVARKRGGDVRQAGDITAVAPEGHALTDETYIECKHYKDLQIDSFVVKGNGNLSAFWVRTCKEAGDREKAPWLIARQNRMPTLLITPQWHRLGSGIYRLADIQRSACSLWLFDDVMNSKPPERFINATPSAGLRRSNPRVRERLEGS